jgi:hypothetical protein
MKKKLTIKYKMIYNIILRNFHIRYQIRYQISIVSNPKYVIYTYSGYRFENKKKKVSNIYDVIANH